MKGYLSIGAVAKKKGVSIKSLRYYDRIGVLKPAYVNRDTNYRYYTEEQMYLLDAISLCIELGIPLRDFEKYSDGEHFQLQELLYDGKMLAEQKILDIRSRLETVQAALHALDYKPVPMQKKETSKQPEHTAGTPSAGLYTRNLPARTVLTSPLEDDEPINYSQKILRLFMLAQLLGMTASYPSGLLYDYMEDGSIRKYIFVHVENFQECTDRRLRTFPAGPYLCRQNREHRIDDAPKIMKEAFQKKMPLTVIETDLMEEDLKKEGHSLEMQILV